jgi:hypothetical protein
MQNVKDGDNTTDDKAMTTPVVLHTLVLLMPGVLVVCVVVCAQ